jgi:hypothetical protein
VQRHHLYARFVTMALSDLFTKSNAGRARKLTRG